MLLVEPVVVRPLLAEWNAEKPPNRVPTRTKRLNEAERRLALGFQRAFPEIGTRQTPKGIEIHAYAAELARVSVWIGEI